MAAIVRLSLGNAWRAVREWWPRVFSWLFNHEYLEASFEHVRYTSLSQFSASILDTYIYPAAVG